MSDGDELPSNWVRAPLGELGDWYGGGTPSKANEKFWSNGKIPWFSPKDMKAFRLQASEDRITRAAVDSSSVDVFPPDTVLMVVRSGILAHTFPVAVAGVEATMNQDLKGVVPKDGVDATYLAYALRNSGRDILNQCSKAGTTVASIDTLALHRYSLPLAPTNEQQRVVEKLDELLSDLDAGIAALERARANLKRYRAAVLKAAVEGRLTEKWRAAHPDAEPAEKLLERILAERRKKWEEAQLKKYAEKGKAAPEGWKDKYIEPAKPDVAVLPELPKGWCWVTLDQLIERPLSNGRSVQSAEEGFPVLRLTALKGGYVDCDEQKIGAWDRKDAAQFLISEGDFLIARGNGSLKLVGRGGFVRQVKTEVAYPDTMIRASITHGVRDYIRLLWDGHLVREQIESIARTSAGIYKVAQPDLEQICIPLPRTGEVAAVVEEIDGAFSVCDFSETQLDHGRRRSDVLRQSILKRAFEGRLVPQDPKDEPASELLARIRAGREVDKGLIGQRNSPSMIRKKTRTNME